MNRRLMVGAGLFFALSSIGYGGARSAVAVAACHVKTQAVVASAAVVTPVPLAVAVGVPVAEITPYYYSYSAYASYASQSAPPVDVDALATKLAEKLAAAAANGGGNKPPQPSPPDPAQPSKLAPQSLIAQKCSQCHSGPAPKGNLSLENPAALDCPTRLKAIRAVLLEKMPQGGPKLTPDEAGKVLEELVGH